MSLASLRTHVAKFVTYGPRIIISVKKLNIIEDYLQLEVNEGVVHHYTPNVHLFSSVYLRILDCDSSLRGCIQEGSQLVV